MDSLDSNRISVPGCTQVSSERLDIFAYRTVTFLFLGLFGGTITAVSAVLLWKKRLRELDWVKEDEEGQQR